MNSLQLNGLSLDELQGLAVQYSEMRSELKKQNFEYFKFFKEQPQRLTENSRNALFQANVSIIKIIDDCLNEINGEINQK
ncbi:MAG: hypothetical protein KKA65_03975 [Nanoarchaeota archaeon]|nr:hypothetical protein [Nanoarchaeota archaeon]MBU4242230.1 hypothetical protein [Nanoarchaeota archaeon]MBU4351594.1 hypothetical protein [Nanoarchaeota archaeon]MBU4456635.1 hypothetical protein [Nanoarchaeota archaeon]MCG2719508.1 hypothetical protein [Nanoarchaeota archaeon]